MAESRYRQLIRCLRIATRKGKSIEQLAREFRVSTRTIRRDLAALKTVGVNVTERRI